jgi:outer membrane lipoprotein-sorting protein
MIRPRSYAGALKAVFLGTCLLIQGVLFAADLGAGISPPDGEHVEGIIGKMKAAYAQVEDYQMETEVKVYKEGQVVETKRFLYTFRKPDHIRIDMESPYAGMVLVYPGEDGKVAVKPGGLFGFLKLHLSPDSALLRTAAGQRIDQTDIGLLVKNIDHSLTDRRHGEASVSGGEDGQVLIEVLAEDHFLAGVLTLYHFSIDKTRWLPVEVREFTPKGILKREVRFRNLRTSIGIPESFFRIITGRPEHGQSNR